MTQNYSTEKDGKIDFYNQFLPRVNLLSTTQKELFETIQNKYAILNGNLLTFDLSVNDFNETLLGYIKYFSELKAKKYKVPANIIIVELNSTKAYLYKSKNYIGIELTRKEIKNFVGGEPEQILDYSNTSENLIKLLNENEFIDPDKNTQKKVLLLPIIIIAGIIGLSTTFLIKMTRKKQPSEINKVSSVDNSEINPFEIETKEELPKSSYLPASTVAVLRDILESNEPDGESEQKPENSIYELQPSETNRTRRRSTRGENNSNDSIEDTLINYEELKDTYIMIDSISEYKERLLAKIYFKYGSFLNIDKSSVEVEKYLLIAKLDTDRKEYASVLLALNELLGKIPEEKRDSAKFTIMGYADSTLFNGKIEISKRSEKFNTELSLKRAESIKKILVGKDFNISPDRIVTHGFGYSKNIDETTNLEKYRRVDIIVSD